MEQHPVPQQISSYEFRLVGDMTIKQFGQVAGGVIVALIIHATGLPGFIRWPLTALSIILGVAMAFFPIEERPIQTWILAFLKAAYSPTQYFWQKQPQIPEVLAGKRGKYPTVKVAVPTKALPAGAGRLASYLASLPRVKSETEAEEERFLERVKSLFSTLPAPPQFVIGVEGKKAGVDKRKKKKEEAAGIRVRKLPGSLIMEIEEEEREKELERERLLAQVARKAPFYSPEYTPLPKVVREKKEPRQAEFGEIPMPGTPTIPNVVVGMVTDKEGKIVEGAIIEIRDEQGNPVRAFKTNKLGQFQVVTPMPNGNYEIEVEKEGLEFDLSRFRLSGKIVEPIRIRAK